MTDKFLVRDSENNILRAYPLSNYASPVILPGEIHEPISEEMLLPEAFYAQQARPEWIKLTGINTFELLPGKYGDRIIYTANASISGETCQIAITRKISAHKVISKADGVYENLGPDDVAAIIETDVAEAVDIEFDSYLPVSIFGKTQEVTFTNGEGVLDINYAGNELAVNPVIYIAGESVALYGYEVPESIKNMTKLRRERNARIASCDPLIIRHLTQQATPGLTPTLTQVQFEELLNYMQALRDMPETETNPANPTWPTKPSFMS